MEYYYRYQEARYSENSLMLILHKYEIIKETPCGVWIDICYGTKRFIKKGTRKQYACPTLELALESFRARKKRQIRILKHQLMSAEKALELDPNGKISYLEEYLE